MQERGDTRTLYGEAVNRTVCVAAKAMRETAFAARTTLKPPPEGIKIQGSEFFISFYGTTR